jgi:hypothetical protein
MIRFNREDTGNTGEQGGLKSVSNARSAIRVTQTYKNDEVRYFIFTDFDFFLNASFRIVKAGFPGIVLSFG